MFKDKDLDNNQKSWSIIIKNHGYYNTHILWAIYKSEITINMIISNHNLNNNQKLWSTWSIRDYGLGDNHKSQSINNEHQSINK